MSTSQPLHTPRTGHLPVWSVTVTEGSETYTERVCGKDAAHAVQQLAGFLALETTAFSEVSARRAQ